MNCRIADISARQIIDSRGNPTIEATVTLENGVKAHASVPSGASTGHNEAHELRDGDPAYLGKSVYGAVANINGSIKHILHGAYADDQRKIDKAMTEADGTDNKRRFGANAILSVSLACAKAAAEYHRLELYEYIGGKRAITLPVPMMNVLNGGAHAGNNLDIQEFMIMPKGAVNFEQAVRMCCEIYQSLKKLLASKGLTTNVGDEGGFAPDLKSEEEALSLLSLASESAGYIPGKDIFFALDCAASEWESGVNYRLPKRNVTLSHDELIDYYTGLVSRWPLVSIEDPFAQEDFASFSRLTGALSKDVQIVGDDLFTTNTLRLKRGIATGAANAILIKPNQIGTLTETMDCVRLAQESGYKVIISHRSGETEDTSIADIAVGLNAGQIKTGAPARSERAAKYNRLLYISQRLSPFGTY
ncbi:MAG: phosphopyruvate hydratase [Clostridiales bacterium]|nr:phosphopyruvate hydratase [Clostridiales bacterium]